MKSWRGGEEASLWEHPTAYGGDQAFSWRSDFEQKGRRQTVVLLQLSSLIASCLVSGNVICFIFLRDNAVPKLLYDPENLCNAAFSGDVFDS